MGRSPITWLRAPRGRAASRVAPVALAPPVAALAIPAVALAGAARPVARVAPEAVAPTGAAVGGPAVLLAVATLAVAALAATPAAAQELAPSRPGPVIMEYGAVYDVPAIDLPTPLDREYRVLFEVATSPEDGSLNPALNTVARFLNMHARAGVPREWLHAALVVHGPAAKDLLAEEPYRARYGRDNPNAGLIRALAAAGVEVYLCGQSSMARGLPPAELLPEVRMALSAMTARAVLQARGYEVVN